MFQAITIVGRLGKEPEMRYLPSGDAVTSFSVATDRTFTKADQKVKETTWWRVSAFGKQGENCAQYLHKGSMVLVEGTLTVDAETGGPRTWSDQSGKTRASFEMRSNTVRFLSPKSESNGNGTGDAGMPSFASRTEDEGIPF